MPIKAYAYRQILLSNYNFITNYLFTTYLYRMIVISSCLISFLSAL